MAEKKSIVEQVYPGDIVGLHDTGNFKIGDSLTEGEDLHFKGIPSFSPEMFRFVENADPLKSKHFTFDTVVKGVCVAPVELNTKVCTKSNQTVPVPE